jgi:hypothetical protein
MAMNDFRNASQHRIALQNRFFSAHWHEYGVIGERRHKLACGRAEIGSLMNAQL